MLKYTMQMLKIQHLAVGLFFSFLWAIDAAIQSDFPVKALSRRNYLHSPHPQLNVNKVSLTQKGYIQFLRYIIDVPPITEYTFCIWFNSNNFSTIHPLLSYSKHEKERLIRVWLSPFGSEVNLEILGKLVFKIPSSFQENHWYHLCQSWSSHQGAWYLFLNGKLKFKGLDPKLQGVIIKGGGDIAVGQELTDFDRGLDDGIEGDVYGFNFVLDSTYKQQKYPLRRFFHAPPYYGRDQLNVYKGDKRTLRGQHFTEISPVQSATVVPRKLITLIPPIQEKPKHIFKRELSRHPRGLFDILFDLFRPDRKVRLKTIEEFNEEEDDKLKQIHALSRTYPRNIALEANKSPNIHNSRVINDIHGGSHVSHGSVGLALVELGFNCALGKGAPISGRKVLVSWTKTPVRVFGGAMLKPTQPFCLNPVL